VSTFLLGYAAARAGGDPDELDRLAGAALDLARRWDKSADEIEHEDDDPEVEDELASADA
jgi:hypothetical protein